MVKKSVLFVLGFCLLFLGPLQVTEAALVAKWTFNEGSGTTAFDSSGNGNDGTLGGDATFITNGFMGAVELDGDVDYITVPYSASLDVAEVTMVVWYYVPSPVVVSGQPTIVGKPINNSYALWYFESRPIFNIKLASGSTATMNQSGTALPSDNWNFVAATYPDTTVVAGQVRMTLYSNEGGSLGIIDALDITGTPGAGGPLASSAFGYEIGGTNGNLGVIIDEIQVYDHPMGIPTGNYVPPPEIQAIYDAGPTPLPLSLSEGWTLFSTGVVDPLSWDSFQVTDGIDTYNVLDANAASWIQQTIYYFDAANQQFKLVPTDDQYLYYYHGYWLWSKISGLGLSY